MFKQKSTIKLNPLLKKIIQLVLSCAIVIMLLNNCMVVKFDAHFATKGTKIENKNEEPGMPSGTYGLHLKNGISAQNNGANSEGSHHGDTQLGAGIELKVGPKLGDKTEVLGVLGYHRYYYFVGNDDFVKLGLQARRYFKNDNFWLGLEGSLVKDWAYLKDIANNPDVGYAGYIFNPITQQLEYRRTRTADGWMAGIVGGYKIKQIKALDVSVFAGSFLMHLGDFKSKQDEITKECHYNLHLKAGLEVALPFSK